MKLMVLFLLYSFASLQLIAQAANELFQEENVEDEYDWLEDIDSNRTKLWLKGQKTIARDFLKKARIKYKGLSYLEDYANNRFDLPIKEGKHFYKFLSYDPNYSPALYIQAKLRSQALQFVVPNDISSKDEIRICDFWESPDGKFLAFSFSRNGSACDEIRIKKIIGKYFKDHIEEAIQTNIAWKKDGFYYLKRTATEQLKNFGNPALMYHRLGTRQEEDELIYQRKSNQTFDLSFSITPSQDYLIIKEYDRKRKRYNIFIKNLRKSGQPIRPLIVNNAANIEIVFNKGKVFYAQTDYESNLNSLVSFHVNQPKKWRQIIPPYEDALLIKTKVANNQFLCKYQVGSQPIISFYNFEGKLLHSIPFSAGYGLDFFIGSSADEKAVLFYTSYFFPPISMVLDLNDYSLEVVEKMQAGYFKVVDYKIESSTYKSKDGTDIPINIVYKKGLIKDGSNPTLLKTYGANNHIHFPEFDPGLIYFMEKGGVFAYSYVRGEGILGRDWALQGQNLNKQNAIDDFLAAASFLIQEGYTNSNKLGITGTGHGALVAATAATKRPDLFKAMVLKYGIFDLLNSELFTINTSFKYEYGDINKEKELKNLLTYTPLQYIQQGIDYPATLIFAAENDPFFPAFHSFKLAAKLQDNFGQINPVILKVGENMRHYGAITWKDRQIALANMYSFLLQELIGAGGLED